MIFLMTSYSCSSGIFPGVFKIDIGQGNIITQERIDQLSNGMTQSQVVYLLGSPMIQDPLHPNQWDYFYSFSKAGAPPTTYHIRLFFKDKRLAFVSGQLPDDTTPHLKTLPKDPPPATPPS